MTTKTEPVAINTDADLADQLRRALTAANSAMNTLRARGFEVCADYGYDDAGEKQFCVVGIHRTETVTL